MGWQYNYFCDPSEPIKFTFNILVSTISDAPSHAVGSLELSEIYVTNILTPLFLFLYPLIPVILYTIIPRATTAHNWSLTLTIMYI